MKKILFKFVSIIRFILNIPLIIVSFVGNLYAMLLISIDKRNHNSFWQETLQKSIDKFVSKKINIGNDPIKYIQFYIPSKVAGYRVKTLFSKEPETIKWLNRYGSEKNCLYDIGANMGIYSIFYAKKFNSKVYSFEPSYKNLDLMIRNIKLNLLQNNITVIPNALTNNFIFSNFYQNDFTAGEAQATFEKKIDELKIKKNKKDTNKVLYRTLGLSIDNLIDSKVLEPPKLIKIDVDGNEVEIIDGCYNLLNNLSSATMLIETRKKTQEIIEKKLDILGFKKIDQVRDNSIWEK